MPIPPARIANSTLWQRTPEKRGVLEPQISPLPPFFELEFCALTFHESLQLFKQVLVLRAYRLHEIRKMQRSIFRIQKLPDTHYGGTTLHFFRAQSRRVAKSFAFENTEQEALSK